MMLNYYPEKGRFEMQMQERNAEFYAPLIKAAAGLIFLWILRAFLIRMPMIRDLTIPDVQFTGPALVKIIIAVLMIVVLVNLGREFGPRLASGARTLPHAKTILDSFIYVICVLLAYDALSWPAQLLLEQDFWIYRWFFLILAVPGIYRGGVAVYKSIDDITALATRGRSRTGNDLVPCAVCAHLNPADASFCSKCGAAMEVTSPISEIICSKCEAENPSEAAFCTTCGAKL